MSKWLTLFLILAFVATIACKKEEEQKTPESTSEQTAPPQAKPEPKAGAKNPAQPASPLEMYNEKQLVVSITPDQFKDVFTSDVSIQDKKLKGVAVRDLLQKNKLKGAYVILSGPFHSVSLTWDKANADGLYIVAFKTGLLQLKTTAPGNFPVSDFPGRIVKITTSASSALPAVKKATQTAKKP